MSILIKGMEMPTGCDDCYFCGELGICYVLVATHINGGVVGGYRYSEFERPPFCPLVPVPPHGRLIDADKLLDEGADLCVCGKNREIWGFSYDMINNALTIISAEEGK